MMNMTFRLSVGSRQRASVAFHLPRLTPTDGILFRPRRHNRECHPTVERSDRAGIGEQIRGRIAGSSPAGATILSAWQSCNRKGQAVSPWRKPAAALNSTNVEL